MTEPFSAESRLVHAGTERMPGHPATPPLVPASVEPAADLITDVDQALEVL